MTNATVPGTAYAAHVHYNTSRSPHAFVSYSILLYATDDAVTDRLDTAVAIENNVDRSSGVFASLEDALVAIHHRVDAPFAVYQNRLSGAYQFFNIDVKSKDLPFSQRVATVGSIRGVVIHEYDD